MEAQGRDIAWPRCDPWHNIYTDKAVGVVELSQKPGVLTYEKDLYEGAE